jgi:hypothetical protein
MKNPQTNPYREGSLYFKLFAFMQSFKGKPFTFDQVMEYAKTELNMITTAATASVTVVMSPREVTEWPKGMGNMSAKGEFYLLHPLNRKETVGEDGITVKEDQRFQLRWRKEVLTPFSRENRGFTPEEIEARNARLAKHKEDREAEKLAFDTDKAKRKAERLAKREAKAAALATAKTEKATAKEAKVKAKETAAAEKAKAKEAKEAEKAEAAKLTDAEKAKAKAEREAKREARIKTATEAKEAKATAKAAKVKEREAKAAEAKAAKEAKAAEKEAAKVKAVPSETAEGNGNSEAETANAEAGIVNNSEATAEA